MGQWGGGIEQRGRLASSGARARILLDREMLPGRVLQEEIRYHGGGYDAGQDDDRSGDDGCNRHPASPSAHRLRLSGF